MIRRASSMVAQMVLLLSSTALAQEKTNLVGSYTLASIFDETADGKKHDTWGSGVKGGLILTPTGQFSVSIVSANRDQNASSSPRTPVGPMVNYYGNYTINDGGKTLTYHVLGSSFPAWDGIDRKAEIELASAEFISLITVVKGDATTGDFKAHQVWKRNP